MPQRPKKKHYVVQNYLKYRGNIDRITTRSSWEWSVCRFLDFNENVAWWSSETIVVPYICATDGKKHRYYVDFTIGMKNGAVYLVEIKPLSQTQPPKLPRSGRVTKGYTNSMQAYYKNISKWDAATKYAAAKGWSFRIWTEREMRKMGIRFLG